MRRVHRSFFLFGIGVRIRDCIVSSGTFHPNEKGHQAYSLAIIEALRNSGLIVAPSS
jgi:hypothetical protein